MYQCLTYHILTQCHQHISHKRIVKLKDPFNFNAFVSKSCITISDTTGDNDEPIGISKVCKICY